MTSLLATFLIASLASAQTTNGTLRGTVKDESGGALPGATVEAINDENGARAAATTEANGFFNIAVSPGSYTVTATLPSFSTETKKVRVLVGQIVRLDYELKVSTRVSETVTVSAAAAVDFRTPEVTTNVTPEQIRYLPQNSRNFLNFAALAPGVAVTADFGEDTRYGGAMFRSGGQDARQVNVFIDGLSYKNDILKGGAFMQDSSRGNPFPQDSVGEFQVLTQNYKAEYENAAAAIINVSTRSGTNDLHGDAFLFYQSRGMVAKTIFQDRTPDYKRYQWGASLGGPIMRDRLFGFGSYEQNDQDRFNTVLFGHPTTEPPEVAARFTGFDQGDVKSPFHSKLAFGKLTWQPSTGETAEFTGNWRDESDRRDFGGQRAFSTGVDQTVKTASASGKLDSVFGNFFNDASLSWQQMKWIQGAIDTSTPHLIYFDIAEIGGRDTIQNVVQKRWTLRDVGTLTMGNHVIKGGATYAWANYDYDNAQNFNPNFFFRSQDLWLFPYHARFGFGQPAVKFDNREFGVFLQDDWSITPRLQLNAGIRWEYETNQLNNNFVTPPDVVAAVNSATATDYNGSIAHLSDIINLHDYISTGSNRPSYKNAFQPRLGLSYDVFGNGNTVFTGAWGRYVDHVNLQDIYLEQQRTTWKFFDFCFTDPRSTAAPDCGNPVPWNDSYLSRAGLEGLIASGLGSGPEIDLLRNSTKPPRTDQWNVGVHQRVGSYLFGLSYNDVRGYNGLIWFPAAPLDVTADKPDRGGHFFHANGFGNILYSTSDRRTWYHGVFVTAERPYTASSRWGFSISYTYAYSRQLGNENKIEGTAYAFDFLHPQALRRVRGDNDERHHVVASGILGLPWDVRLSTFLTLGSGVPFTIFDFSHDAASIRWNEGNPPRKRNIFGLWAYESLDLRLSKDFLITHGVTLGVQGEVFNVTNFKNYCNFIDFYLDTNLGKPRDCQYNTRRAQLGVNLGF